jgi:hypothetical protein
MQANQTERSEAELSLETYHRLFEKYEKRFEGNELGLPAYKLADFYAGWEMECRAKEVNELNFSRSITA